MHVGHAVKGTRRWLLATVGTILLGATRCGEIDPLPPVPTGDPDSLLTNPPDPPVILE